MKTNDLHIILHCLPRDIETSQLPKEFFADKFEMMKQRCDWTSKNIFEINDSNRCLGINDKRRNSIRENNPGNFMYLDTDVHFSMFNLSYLFRALEQIDSEDTFQWDMILRFG